jgi:hypothetical protein
MGIIHAESELPTNWFDTHGFFLIHFWTCGVCVLFGIEQLNASESFDNMNLNMKSMGKHTYIWNYQILELSSHVIVFALDDDLILWTISTSTIRIRIRIISHSLTSASSIGNPFWLYYGNQITKFSLWQVNL